MANKRGKQVISDRKERQTGGMGRKIKTPDEENRSIHDFISFDSGFQFFFSFFFDRRSDSWPESDSSSLELLLELLESLEESLACPDRRSRSTLSAIAARSGSCFLRTLYHFLESLGRPRTVLCHTTGKLVFEAKFCVTAIVVSRLRTTCQIPPGTNTVSPGFWMHSIGRYFSGQSGRWVLG